MERLSEIGPTISRVFQKLTFAIMQLFFTNDIRGEFAHLPEEEARHCVQVLRKREGDTLTFVDGKGGWYEGVIAETAKKRCVVQIQKQLSEFQNRPFYLHIAIAPTKNISRFEWFLEKATEIGIDEITPLFCERSERKRVRIDRLQKIVLSAMKQSLKAYLPVLNEPVSFSKFMQQDFLDYQKFITHCHHEEVHLQHLYTQGDDAIILIGPEGDFSEKEVKLAVESGFVGSGLGRSRLRTETAGIVACHTVSLKN